MLQYCRMNVPQVGKPYELPQLADGRVGGVRQACGLEPGVLAFTLRDQLRVNGRVLGGRRGQLGIFIRGSRLDGLEPVDRPRQFPDVQLQLK